MSKRREDSFLNFGMSDMLLLEISKSCNLYKLTKERFSNWLILFDDRFKHETEECFPNSPTTLLMFPSVTERYFRDLQTGNDRLSASKVAFWM